MQGGSSALETVQNWIGFVALAGSVVLLALIERLRMHFVSRSDWSESLKGFQQRLEVMDISQADMDTRLDGARDRLTRLEERDQHQAELMAEAVVKPLQAITQRMEAVARRQARQGEQLARATTTLGSLAKLVARLERRMDRDDDKGGAR